MRALAAGEDAHGGEPGRQLVTCGTFAQQWRQLGDVRFFRSSSGGARSPVPGGLFIHRILDFSAPKL
jgi:hypothetical protein